MHENVKQDLKTGTTTVGIVTKTSVVLAADMRASMGNIAYDEESEKLYEITDFLAVTNAGNVGDSQTIIKFLKSQAKLYEIERRERMSAKAAATLLSSVLNSARYYPYIVQLLIGGFDLTPALHEVTPFGGMLERKKYGATGSGTDYALTTLDQNYYVNMSDEEAIKLAIKAVEASKKRDLYTGGVSTTVMIIDSKGTRRLKDSEVRRIVEDLKTTGPEMATKKSSKQFVT